MGLHLNQRKLDAAVESLRPRPTWFVQTAMYAYHRNPEYWKDPEKFLPDRFLTAKGDNDMPFAPFGDVSICKLLACSHA